MRISYWSSDVCSSDLDAGHDDGAYLARSKPGRSADPVRNAPPNGKTVPPARQTIAELLPSATAQEAKRQKHQRGDRRYRQTPGKAITSHKHLSPPITVDGQARTDEEGLPCNRACALNSTTP